MEERAEWVVLVDESGNFDDPTRPVCVGGLVLADDAMNPLRARREEVAS